MVHITYHTTPPQPPIPPFRAYKHTAMTTTIVGRSVHELPNCPSCPSYRTGHAQTVHVTSRHSEHPCIDHRAIVKMNVTCRNNVPLRAYPPAHKCHADFGNSDSRRCCLRLSAGYCWQWWMLWSSAAAEQRTVAYGTPRAQHYNSAALLRQPNSAIATPPPPAATHSHPHSTSSLPLPLSSH